MQKIEVYIIVFLVKIIGGTLSNYRLILLKEGNKFGVSVTHIFASIFWLISVGLVIDNIMGDPFIAIPFVLGLVISNYIGILIDNLFKSGQILTTVITSENNNKLIDSIKDSGFEVASLIADGKESGKKVIMIATPRKKHNNLLKIIKNNNISNLIINESTREVTK